MASYFLSESAQQDIISIRNYTTDIWGQAQTSKYLTQLQQRLEWLANNPALGKLRNEVKEGYLSFPEGRHIIFYRVAACGIEVMGVIHQSEDIDTHLNN
jgi:toxin ParE1/3/4